MDWYLVVCSDKVNCGENFGSMEGGREVLYMGDRISVWCGDVVEGSVVPARSPISLGLLGHHMQWGGPGAVGRLYDSQLQHVFELLTSNLKFFWGEASNSGGEWWASCTDMVRNIVFDRSVLVVVNSGDL